MALLAGCNRQGVTDNPPAPPLPATSTHSATNPPSVSVPAKPTFQTLTGKWLRPDGEYVLDIRSVDAGGKMLATYWNPRQINVAKAEAAQDGDAIKVFVELRDVNYPGCTYTLFYDATNDLLKGVYFQAAMQQNYDVVFERLKQSP